MKFDSWRRLKSVEKEFLKSLYKLSDMFVKIARTYGNNQQRYQKVMKEFQESEQYERYINSAVKRMVTPLDVSNQKHGERQLKSYKRNLSLSCADG